MNGRYLNKKMIMELENAESRYWSEYYGCVLSNLRNKLGIKSNIINGAFAGALINVDILAFGNGHKIDENYIHSLK